MMNSLITVLRIYSCFLSCPHSLIVVGVTTFLVARAAWRYRDCMQVVALQHGHVVRSTAFRHTVELLNSKSQLAYVHQSKVFCAGVSYNNLHLREVTPRHNAVKDYGDFAVESPSSYRTFSVFCMILFSKTQCPSITYMLTGDWQANARIRIVAWHCQVHVLSVSSETSCCCLMETPIYQIRNIPAHKRVGVLVVY
jgi:hypothetical protein